MERFLTTNKFPPKTKIDKCSNEDIMVRYYKGKYPVLILFKANKKSIIKWKTNSIVGTHQLGFEERKGGQIDIVPTRLLWKRQKSQIN
ncbi:MAG: hypothetical protein ACTSVV_04190 [Promethearchaeota archaeon]